jgi:hypothetical protein
MDYAGEPQPDADVNIDGGVNACQAVVEDGKAGRGRTVSSSKTVAALALRVRLRGCLQLIEQMYCYMWTCSSTNCTEHSCISVLYLLLSLKIL